MQIKATMSSKGQIVIPKQLRENLGLHKFSELLVNLRQDRIIELKPVEKKITDFFGKGKHKNNKIVNIDQAIEQAVKLNNRY